MFIVALTGGIASGKSTVAKIIHQMGIPLIDSDLIAREVVEPHRPAWQKIREEFGESILHPDLTLNRERLGQIIFGDQAKRQKLNAITHPYIYKAIFRRLLSYLFKGYHYAVIDLPLLYESGYMLTFVYKTIVVSCTPSQQLQRLMARNELEESDAKMRINAQMSLEEKCRRADYVIDNSGDLQSTEAQIKMILSQLNASKHHWINRTILLTVFLVVPLTLIVFLLFYFC